MIVILDFGSQSTHLIKRRLIDLGFDATIVPHTTKDIKKMNPKGIIFSGSPFSVYEKESLTYDYDILNYPVPKLGICYGFQCVVNNLGGSVKSTKVKEFGECDVFLKNNNVLFKNIDNKFTTWMSHGDSIAKLTDDFELLAESSSHIASAYSSKYNFWGLQFHPELSHSLNGKEILNNFARHICKIKPSKKTIENTFNSISKSIKDQVGNNDILALVSGGVDSSVVSALLLKILDPKKVHLMYIDTGLMRKNESKEIEEILLQLNAKNLHIIDAKNEFLTSLNSVIDPEEKRKIIGNLFVEITLKEVKKLKFEKNFYLAQGTLYTDLIESGKGVGNKAKTIKSHHNVNSPLIIEKRESGFLVEPLKELYKDDVRSLGLFLNLPENLIFRHPFPGPGLGIRIIGEITKEKVSILQEADAIFIDELKKRNLYSKIWQAFAVLISAKSVGVAGDTRKYGWTIGLRAISSIDGVSADIYDFDIKDLKEISARITNEISSVARVVYDISSKPPATIEWE